MLNWKETIQHIQKTGCSICRYGDGEFDLVWAYRFGQKFNSGFQHYNEKLGKRLAEILAAKEDCKVLVCLPSCMILGTNYLYRRIANIWHIYAYRNIDNLLGVANLSKVYGDTNITRFYLSHKDKKQSVQLINSLKQLWRGKNVLLVEGEKSRLGIGNDLFDEAKTIRRIICPATDAFDLYDEILQTTLEKATSDTLVLLALGMTATVLAYDLSQHDIQALDIGHIDIEYEWFKMNATKKVPIKGKFTNEAVGGRDVEDNNDSRYLSQIIVRIS